MARHLFWLSDEAWLVIEPHLPHGRPGKPRVDDRVVISGKITDLVAGVDWLKGRQSRASVRSTIQIILNELAEEPYPEELWNEKVEVVWNYVLKRFADGRAGHA